MRFLLWLAVITAAAYSVSRLPIPDPHDFVRRTPTTVITEDSPGWDCHTMGNRICGRP